MTRDDDLQLEKMIEVIVRVIPKETAQAKLYRETAARAQREMVRMLFSKLASQSEEHREKLKATLEILKKEQARVRGTKGEADPAVCIPADEFNANIRNALRLTRELKKLADKGMQDANDPSCRAMYERMKAVSDELRALAEDEVEGHIMKDKWN
jgi:rubrerythrin